MTEFIRKRTVNAKNDILSGATVALALVPEAVAFAFVAGVDPLVGLYAAFMVGIITAIFGGRPGMISGATGALAVVMVSLVAEGNAFGAEGDNLGLYYLFTTVILMGFIQMLAGVLKLGKFVRLIPHPVMMGFVNGLAIVIFLSQLNMFKTHENGELNWMQGTQLFTMMGLVALTMAIMFGLPKLTKKLPEALIAILAVSAIAIFGNLEVATVGSFIRDGGGDGLKGGLPQFQTALFSKVPFTWETLKFIGPYALILAAIGLIESLMTLNLVDELTETRGNTNRECLAQGGANIVTGLFGGMGGCAMIGQSLINIKSGGRTRLSGITAAVLLLIFIVFASSFIERIPIAALVGV
ncbi:MAG TPA: SulP family inorganic anion transporter, partial [Mariniflexile sp.]|nr:SulP family inorganic anion transporter [Mariniflexile sp.]